MNYKIFLFLLFCISSYWMMAQDKRPVDGVVKKRLLEDRFLLPYEPVREADIFWEKRLWQVIDTREKMNKYLARPNHSLVEILIQAGQNGDIKLYSTENDNFTTPLTSDEVDHLIASTDTIVQFDPETYEEKIVVAENMKDFSNIHRYRIKEVWFFDENTSTMKVRILGIAPLEEKHDEAGNFLYEAPMFWAYYPHCRQVLSKHQVFNPLNDNSPMSMEDMLEMRFFSSYVVKESNVYDRRLQDYLTGIDILLESQKIKDEIFNFEQDLWSY